MKTLTDLYKIAEKDNISVDAFSLPETESLSLMDSNGGCYIAIDPKQIKDSADEKIKLAHELGHCETGSFYNRYAANDLRGKHEKCADKWSFNILIPFEDLNAAIVSGIVEPWELAEHFNVPESYIREAVRYYIEQKGLCFSAPSKVETIVEESKSHKYREQLKRLILHITFDDPNKTIDEISEGEAKAVLKALGKLET